MNSFRLSRVPAFLALIVVGLIAAPGCNKTPAPVPATKASAVKAAVWGMPIVSVDAMRQAFLRDAGGRYNDIAYFSTPADWRFQITTPNASTHYVYIPIQVKQGPVVFDIPAADGAGLFGSFNDAWQVPHADVGPQGEDQGKGGKYLILPPGYTGEVPSGYITLRLPTFNGYAILRAIPKTTAPADVAKALALVKKTRVYSLTQAASPPEQRYIDIAGKTFNGLATFDDRFYDSLALMVSEEPVQDWDAEALTALSSIGIEQGRPFNPDAATRGILKQGVLEARAGFMQFVKDLPPFASNSHWQMPGTSVGPETGFTFVREGKLLVGERGALFFLGCAPAMKFGGATFYLLGTQDAASAPLNGSNAYRLRVPPNVPVEQFWAATVYDLETAGFFLDSPRIELSSYDQTMRRNADGSVDLYFGPTTPLGNEQNWIYTTPGKPWFAIFRFYGPRAEIQDKTWTLPDIEPL